MEILTKLILTEREVKEAIRVYLLQKNMAYPELGIGNNIHFPDIKLLNGANEKVIAEYTFQAKKNES